MTTTSVKVLLHLRTAHGLTTDRAALLNYFNEKGDFRTIHRTIQFTDDLNKERQCPDIFVVQEKFLNDIQKEVAQKVISFLPWYKVEKVDTEKVTYDQFGYFRYDGVLQLSALVSIHLRDEYNNLRIIKVHVIPEF